MADTMRTTRSHNGSAPIAWRSVRAWWGSLDPALVTVTAALILIGLVLCLAAGPVAAARIGISNPMHFFERQIVFLVPALLVMATLSTLDALTARRLGVVLGAGAFFAMWLALLVGPEIKGAHRWLDLGPFSLQPSEFMKPGFVIASAWFLAEGARDRSFPGGIVSLGLYLACSATLLLQPDYGQWILLTAIWGVMFFIAGWSWAWIAGLGTAAAGALALGYRIAPHVRSRIDRFLNPEGNDTYQTDKALEAISGGGALGHDLHGTEGVKASLPDAHTDFVFAVAGEEFGFLLCALILALFAAIAFRGFKFAGETRSVFLRCAVCGLSAQLAFQATVNIGVNLSVLPAKGMTLPFVSYGGSSLVATGIAMGLLLALTRRRT
ncbi:FtsW/RodA/SpoVE family cell cycle protein [Parvularcula dongshanensis]|uniref:Probable peptidoglycan glycosyltransferase FtsW n=1 Tax=Parvularcula dongshanensis TaxID=1173995 RepID=A0A840I4V1_9PROT|nr:putative peptidoglycan glycosyltransferase FtsW [Parvularcula dongshanensis]MBB4659869.1 cell division protein FtsW [Parvularcula dongshanensis]